MAQCALVALRDVGSLENRIRCLNIAGKGGETNKNMSWSDTTNLEDCYVAQIEYGMYLSGCKHAIADIVDVVEIRHILPVFWPIFYDEAKPLKW